MLSHKTMSIWVCSFRALTDLKAPNGPQYRSLNQQKDWLERDWGAFHKKVTMEVTEKWLVGYAWITQDVGYYSSETGRIRFRGVRFQTPNSVSFLGLPEFRGANSVSSSQPIICVPKRTHRVSRRTHRVCPKTQWGSVSSLLRNSTLETAFRPLPNSRFYNLFRVSGVNPQSHFLSGPLNRLNAILSLLRPLDRYRTPSVIGSAIGRPLSRPISHPNTAHPPRSKLNRAIVVLYSLQPL